MLTTTSALQYFQLLRYTMLVAVGIVLAKMGLSQGAIGQYETFMFLAAAISFFWLNGLIKALLPIGTNKARSRTNIFSAFVIIQLFSFLAAIFLFLSQPLLSKFLLNSNQIPEVNLLAIFLIFGVPANLVEYYYLLKKQSLSIVIYASVSFGIQFLLIVVPVFLSYPITVALKGLVLAALLRYFWLCLLFVRNKEVFVSLTFIKEYLRLGAPLIAATFLSGSAQFIDGFIVTANYNEATFALFRYGARELPLALLLINALSNAMLPNFGNREKLTENLQQLKHSVLKLMYILFPLTALLLLLSKPLFPLVFNPAFAESASVFNVYLLLIVSRVLMPQTILTGLKITKPIVLASVIELIINVTLSLILVQFMGLMGIALATFMAYLFEKIYLSIVVSRTLNIRLNQYLSVRKYVVFSTVIIVIFIFVELIF